MKLIVGLGNPGLKYERTRHNVGFLVADRLQSGYGRDGWQRSKKLQTVFCRPKAIDLLIAKPQTFMNNSGEAVSSLFSYFKILSSDLYIIHDDLDIKLGEYKIQKGVGPKVHGGINSIEEKLGTKDFWRVRIGVDNRDSINRTSGEAYVLQEFSDDEEEIVKQTIDKLLIDLNDLISK